MSIAKTSNFTYAGGGIYPTSEIHNELNSLDQKKSSSTRKIVWIIISAIIFIIIIAIYDTLKMAITNYFLMKAADDKKCKYKKKKYNRILIKNYNQLIAITIFTLISLFTGIIAVIIALKWLE